MRAVRRDDGREYETVTQAARELVGEMGAGNVNHVTSAIVSCCRGRLKKTYGHAFEYVDDTVSRLDCEPEMQRMYSGTAHAYTLFKCRGTGEQYGMTWLPRFCPSCGGKLTDKAAERYMEER